MNLSKVLAYLIIAAGVVLAALSLLLFDATREPKLGFWVVVSLASIWTARRVTRRPLHTLGR